MGLSIQIIKAYLSGCIEDNKQSLQTEPEKLLQIALDVIVQQNEIIEREQEEIEKRKHADTKECDEMAKYCMDCGYLLKELNYTENSTKYECIKCEEYWFHTRRIVVEWKKQKKK